MNVTRLPGRAGPDEDRYLTPVERSLHRLRLAAFVALEQGATRGDLERRIEETVRLHQRMAGGNR